METQLASTSGTPSLTAEQLTPTSKKRKYAEDILLQAPSLTPPLDQPDNPNERFSRAVSPSLSTTSTPLTDLGPTPTLSPQKHDMGPDAKRRKLTFAEKEVEKAVKKAEKDEKEKQKAEAKAKRDEEKKRKEEEKEAARKIKDALKVEKQKAKDVAQQEKDAEKKRKEAEVLKKERAQLRIGAFFARPAQASTPPTTPDDASLGASSRRSSIASIDMAPSLLETRSPMGKSANPEYSQWILPFFVSEHTELAPFNRFRSKTSLFDQHELSLNQTIPPEKLSSKFRKRERARLFKPVKQIIETANVGSQESSDLTQETQDLDHIPYKCIYFHQDVRPAYQGTYTRPVSPRSARRLARNPTSRGLPDTNYDYDSEAEWQEPEEGDDDLMDEDEMSEDDAGEEEMDDFVDDDGEPIKRQLLNDMEPKSSGLCWEGPDSQHDELRCYRMDVLHDSTSFPIDPYSTTHWSDIGKPSPKKRIVKPQIPAGMQPPRPPLMAVDGNTDLTHPSSILGYTTRNDQNENKTPTAKPKASHTASGKAPKMIPGELLHDFKTAVEGSTLSKVGLIEVLKNQFPKCSKDAIKDTLSSIAVRQGTEKKWVLI